VKGEFEKRAYTKEEIESLIRSRWNETFVNMKDVNEARKTFPLQNFKYEEPREWNLQQYKAAYEKIAHQILNIIEWNLHWFGGKVLEKEEEG
jgi:hypothetical protein